MAVMEAYAAQTVLFQVTMLVEAVEILGAWVPSTASTLTDEFEALFLTVVLAPTFAPSVTSLPSTLLEELLSHLELAWRAAIKEEPPFWVMAAQIEALIALSALSTLVEEPMSLVEEVCAVVRFVAAVATAVSVLADEVE